MPIPVLMLTQDEYDGLLNRLAALEARVAELDAAYALARVAFDGEKRRMLAPLMFDIHDDALSIIVPDEQDRVIT